MKHTYLQIAALHIAALPLLNVPGHPKKIFDADCINSYVLISGVTELHLTKFLRDVQKLLLITILQWKLWFSNPFWNAMVTNEDRRKIAGKSRKNCAFQQRKLPRLLDGRMSTKFGHDVARLLPFNLLKEDLCIWRCMRTSPKLNWLP